MNNNDYVINLINILSFIIGVQNLELNDKQIKDLQEHLNKQDDDYKKIIKNQEKIISLLRKEEESCGR